VDFWWIGKSQHFSGMFKAGFQLAKESSPFFPLAEGTDGYWRYLSAYQSTCRPPGPLSITSTC